MTEKICVNDRENLCKWRKKSVYIKTTYINPFCIPDKNLYFEKLHGFKKSVYTKKISMIGRSTAQQSIIVIAALVLVVVAA